MAPAPNTSERSALVPWFAGSLVIALASFVAFLLLIYWSTSGIRSPIDEGTLWQVSLACGGVWLIWLAATLMRVGNRGLWLLLTAPIALSGPVLLSWIALACALDHSQCP
jgi:hypothetical protein